MKMPRSVGIAIASDCNLRCVYCSHFKSPGDVRIDLPTREWLQFFDELGRIGVMSVILEGGEPLYRDDWRELIQSVVDNGMRYTLLTNGALIDDDAAAFLAGTKTRINMVQISLDGHIPEHHDCFRGKGSFDKAVRGLRKLLEHHIPASVRVTLHNKNVHHIPEICSFLLEETGLRSFSVNSAGYLGTCAQNSDWVQMSSEDYAMAMEILTDMKTKYNGRILAAAGPLADSECWTEMVEKESNGEEPAINKGYLSACGSVLKSIWVRADGMLVPCNHLSHMEIGRINEVDFLDAWMNHNHMQGMRERRLIKLETFEECHNCEWSNFCTGGCPATAYSMTGEVHRPSPENCLKRFIESGGQLPGKKKDEDGVALAGLDPR